MLSCIYFLNIKMQYNHLYILLQLYPDKSWDWYELSWNPNITWEMVCSNPDKPWNWCYLSKHPNITWEVVCSNPDKD